MMGAELRKWKFLCQYNNFAVITNALVEYLNKFLILQLFGKIVRWRTRKKMLEFFKLSNFLLNIFGF